MPKPVIHDCDGHVNDLISSLLLWLSPETELQAVTITNGDCYVDQSFSALCKMATYLDLDLEGPELAYSEDPVPNPFPENWRRESQLVNEMPIFSGNSLKRLYQEGKGRKSETVIKDCLTNSLTPVTIVTTGPLTNVAKVFKDHPELKDNVEEFVMMAGALSVPGNVEHDEHDGSAEWNMFSDPAAAKAVFDLGVPIRQITLDITNQLPLTKDFLEKLEAQAETSKASRLTHALWSMVRGFDYYFWDTVTAAAVIRPSLFTFKEIKADISLQGRSRGKMSTSLFGGRKMKTATAIDKEGFEDLLLETLAAK